MGTSDKENMGYQLTVVQASVPMASKHQLVLAFKHV